MAPGRVRSTSGSDISKKEVVGVEGAFVVNPR
jgi:hypothetical protein